MSYQRRVAMYGRSRPLSSLNWSGLRHGHLNKEPVSVYEHAVLSLDTRKKAYKKGESKNRKKVEEREGDGNGDS